MVFENLVDPILSPLLNLPVFWSILIISLAIAILITLIYKWMTDQHLMKSLKDDIKKFQKEMKELKDDPKKFMKVQKKAMKTNMKYMMHSMKPTLVTFIPIIIIFGWLSANLAYSPINPGQEFTTSAVFKEGTEGNAKLNVPDGINLLSNETQEIRCETEKGWIFSKEVCKAEWALKGATGNYVLEYQFNNNTENKEIVITNQRDYKEPVKVIKEGKLNELKVDHEKVKPIPGLPLGWLGTYIILSIVFSMSLRKIMKLH